MTKVLGQASRAVVVGGGIGGLTAALCLERKGWRVRVLEQAGEISEVGAGIQISPNGVRVLRALDLEAAVSANAFRPEASEMRFGTSGRLLFHHSMADYDTRFGAPYLHIHRADLVSALLAALEARQPGAVQTGQAVSGYGQNDRSVWAQLADGTQAEGDLLIGADGIKSVVRDQMLGVKAPRFTGNVAWRMVLPMARLTAQPPPPTACVWIGEGRHAVTYRLRGGTLANLVGVVECDDWREESWTAEGTREQALADFAGWHPVITEAIGRADTHYRWALFDRPPLDRWFDGRVVLLGDACHPMLPFMAQGAVQSMEDAFVLADQLNSADDLAAGLAAYVSARHRRATRVQAAARSNTGLFHQQTWLDRLKAQVFLWLPDKLLSASAAKRFGWLYGYDVTSGK